MIKIFRRTIISTPIRFKRNKFERRSSMKRRITKKVILSVMILLFTFSSCSVVLHAGYRLGEQVFPSEGLYYLRNYKTKEYMYFDPDASWKWVKCGTEKQADVWYIAKDKDTGSYKISLAQDGSYYLHFEEEGDVGSTLFVQPTKKTGDHLWNFMADPIGAEPNSYTKDLATVYIAKANGVNSKTDINDSLLLYYYTPALSNDYVQLDKHKQHEDIDLEEVWILEWTTSTNAIKSINPTLSSVKADRHGHITVNKEKIKNGDLWKRIKKVEIQYSTDKNFKKNVKKKVIDKNSKKITDKHIKKGKYYYVRIRYTDGKNLKTKWSNKKKFKIKK
jgi:hypothetical protein